MRNKLRIPLFLLLVIASIGVGTVGVHASTDCQHLFRAYQDQLAKHLHHKVSKETLVRWAAWNKAHPHYRPTKKEAMDKIDFVCQVPVADAAISENLPPVDLPPMFPSMMDTFSAPAPPNVVVSSLVPPDNPELPPVADPVFPPVYYPTVIGGVPSPAPTPEPASVLLMATALGLLSVLIYRKRSAERA